MEIRGRENFYLFLDIDGVLWDWKWRIEMIKEGKIKKGGLITNFNPKSVHALNTLIEYLNENYNCKIVISSTWRFRKNMTKSILSKNGVDIVADELYFTPISLRPDNRGEEILTYLENKDNQNNLLIIDDEYFDFPKYFKKCQFIKTDIFQSSLTPEQVDGWITINELKNNNKSESKLI